MSTASTGPAASLCAFDPSSPEGLGRAHQSKRVLILAAEPQKT